MNNPNKEYLQKIFSSRLKQNIFDEKFALSLLEDESLEEMPNNPQKYKVGFALHRTLSRQTTAEQKNLNVVGLELSIAALKEIGEDKDIDLFEVQTNLYIGTFFVYENDPIGLAFVKRGLAESRPGIDV